MTILVNLKAKYFQVLLLSYTVQKCVINNSVAIKMNLGYWALGFSMWHLTVYYTVQFVGKTLWVPLCFTI